MKPNGKRWTNSNTSIKVNEKLKPSERIQELVKINRLMNPLSVDDGLLLSLAIIKYLDEQFEEHEGK